MSMWGAGGAGTSTQYFGLTNVLMFSGGSGALQYIMYYQWHCPGVIFHSVSVRELFLRTHISSQL